MSRFREVVEIVGLAVDGTGVLIIVLGMLIAAARFALQSARKANDAYRSFRKDLGKAILLGLEVLVAGDIIRTVAVSPTLEDVFVLGLIVLIRTFLSLSMELEIQGRLPWRSGGSEMAGGAGSEPPLRR